MITSRLGRYTRLRCWSRGCALTLCTSDSTMPGNRWLSSLCFMTTSGAINFSLNNRGDAEIGNHSRGVLGRDSRPGGSWVRDAAAAGLVASGIELIDLDVVTTPGVAMMVKHLHADAAVIATASHNPIQWNGLKFLNRDATA